LSFNKLLLIVNDGYVSKGLSLAPSVVASVPSVAFIALRPLPPLRRLHQLRCVRCVRWVGWKPGFIHDRLLYRFTDY